MLLSRGIRTSGLEESGAYLVLRGDVEAASVYLHHLVEKGLDPVFVSPDGVNISSDDRIAVLEPDGDNRSMRADGLLMLLSSLTRHLSKGKRKAVVIFGLHALRESNDFCDLTNFIGQLNDQACVKQGLVIIIADPEKFSRQELAFLEREAVVLEQPEQLFSPATSETVK